MNYDLTKTKFPMTALGTKHKILKKCLDKTEIKPVLENLYIIKSTFDLCSCEVPEVFILVTTY